MKFHLRAGAEVDLPSTHEFRSGVEDLRKAIHAGVPKDYFQISEALVPDSSGSGETVLYDCPLGSMAELHRIAFSASGYTGTTPLGNGDVMLWVNGNSLYNFLPQNGAVAPVVFVEGTGAVVLHGGETFTATYENLTVQLNVFMQFRRWNQA